ncbi:FecCD family ABC transporter permease [Breznakiella homolactica]|uniref:Iron ABC transporter permease n=1 Tax=Breznakiella homolactica TaxID=2798577 RepID=A0A7T8B916_9SPIR|nr:iron ABC transporter permease [Breznakiella homolactica]QQO07475.1 iron ABC transporter permease [Breznakiella homolactica]
MENRDAPGAGRRYVLLIILLSLALAAAVVAALFLGTVRLSLEDIQQALLYFAEKEGDGTSWTILFHIRLPRIILALAVGAALSVSGAAFQGFFRNPLADPYVIGASSGAALGAALAVVGGFAGLGPVSPMSLMAFAGALGAVFLAFAISRSAGNPPPAAALLLAGTALSAFFSALLSFILVIHDRDLHRVYYWLLGSLSGASWGQLGVSLPVMAAGCFMLFLCMRPLDLLLQGDEVAESLGVNLRVTRLIIAFGASLATAAAVSAAGVIGFIGLVAPHSVRMMTGPSHRRLLPASALGGALLVLLADIIARIALAPMELPIGIITSLLGAPFFIYLLIRRGRNIGSFS